MINLKIVDKDIVILNNKFVRINSDDALIQQITNQIKIWFGEWFADKTIGIDYVGFENNRYTDKEIISSVTQSIYKNPNVLVVSKIEVHRNRAEGKIELTIEIETVDSKVVIII